MFVKYIGHGDMISADWNGKRFVFSKRRPIVEIPDGLYDFIKSSNFIYKQDVVFMERPSDSIPVPVAESEKSKTIITEIVKTIKKAGRPRKRK